MESMTLAYRLEFLQPDGRWVGPYCAEWMTPAAFAVRDHMVATHRDSPDHPWPDAKIFQDNPGPDRYVCASPRRDALTQWFGPFLRPLLAEGGHLACYLVPIAAIAAVDERQVVCQQRRMVLVSRHGSPPRGPLHERLHPTKARELEVDPVNTTLSP